MQATAGSNKRAEAFSRCCIENGLKPLKLKYSVPTRWNSAYTMIERAVFLKKAVDTFVWEIEELHDYVLTAKEWEQCEVLLSILLPFKLVSDQVEQTTRPGIDKIFWSYETMFGQIDDIEDNLMSGGPRRSIWTRELIDSVAIMAQKLRVLLPT